MAQMSVSDYFKTQKRNVDFHPSKRRKLDQGEAPIQGISKEVVVTPPVSHRTRRKVSDKTSVKLPTIALKSTKGRRAKDTKTDKLQPVISDSFAFTNSCKGEPGTPLEETTAACDDHCSSPPGTPKKRNVEGESDQVTQKRSRQTNAVRKDLLKEFEDGTKTPEKAYDFTRFQGDSEKNEKVVRKKLVLKSPSKNVETEKAESGTVPIFQFSGKSDTKTKNQDVKGKGKIDVSAMRSKLQKSGKLAELQEKLLQFSEKSQLKSPVKKYQPKLLEQSSDKQLIVTPKKDKVMSDPPQVDSRPAYQKYQALAEPVPPTLALPYKYKLLLEKFYAMDTVVSMLHKRSELCTFSKLKAAVQEMARKTFDVKNLGQIKTVYPTAYTFRQEKGLHSFNNTSKGSSYQLTVEADLAPLVANEKQPEVDKYGKPAFTVKHLRTRKDVFKQNLVAVVKDYHKKFLMTLERPLHIDDKKLTRWHPKFNVDAVPEMEVADLPKPPDTKKMTTASEVLEQAKGSLNSRIRRALELTCGEVENNNSKNSPNKCEKKKDGNTSPCTPSKKNNSPGKLGGALKGVSGSLLERIRAKEARKLESSLMRNPEDEKKLQRMERLPELARILRTFFVTQKKPALLEEDVVSKMSESYRSNLGKAETEKHLQLLQELIPDWIQSVNIKRGTYLKIDRNKDIKVIQDKLLKFYNAAK